MAAKLARLTHKIAIQLHLVAERGGQSGNVWIHPHYSELTLHAAKFLRYI
jgi:hypothetical protein